MDTGRATLRLFLSLTLVTGCVICVGCPPPGEPSFSFAVLADPHIAGDATREERLTACVNWVNTNKVGERIDLVLVVGDIGWGDGHMARAREILDGLTMPYIPIIGDNEIQSGYEQEFDSTFTPQYTHLATVFENWQKAPTPVWNSQIDDFSYLENFSFDYKGVHFVGLDWATRVIGGVTSETADLHDFSGGTWPWFTADIENCDKTMQENIVVASHHPMHESEFGSFSSEEDAQLELFTQGYGTHVYADFAGHYHIDFSETRPLGQYEVHITAATWENTVRVVQVRNNGTAFTYYHELVPVP